MSQLNAKLGDMEFDGLITDINPAIIIRSATIAAQESETTLVRGTILSKESDNTMKVLGTGSGTADCILTDDVTVGTEEVVVTVYYAGCFDLSKCTVAADYEVTEADKDALRIRGILFKDAANIL